MRLLHPAEDQAAAAAGSAALEAQVLAVAEQHMGELTAENAAEIGVAAAAPLSLTAGQRP